MMKQKIWMLFGGLIILGIFSSFFGNSFSPKRKIAFQITNELSKKYYSKYALNFMGISEEAREGKYKVIGIELDSKKRLSKDAGRVLLLKCVSEALEAFNSHPSFRKHMIDGSFTEKNLIINIYIQPPDGSAVYYPEIVVFTFMEGQLTFKTNSPENPYRYYSKEFETYDEAVEIVRSQGHVVPEYNGRAG